MQRRSRQMCLWFICEEIQPSLWCPCLWYMLVRGLSFAFHCRVMITNRSRCSSYTAPPNSRQVSGIFTKTKAIWNRIIGCKNGINSSFFFHSLKWLISGGKSAKFSFAVRLNIAACSYMARHYGGRMHTTASSSMTSWKADVCFLHLQTRHSNCPPRAKFSSCSIIVL